MNKKTVKTYIVKMLAQFPHKYRYEMLATLLGITPRYVRILEKGEKEPSEHLRKLIKVLLK